MSHFSIADKTQGPIQKALGEKSVIHCEVRMVSLSVHCDQCYFSYENLFSSTSSLVRIH